MGTLYCPPKKRALYISHLPSEHSVLPTFQTSTLYYPSTKRALYISYLPNGNSILPIYQTSTLYYQSILPKYKNKELILPLYKSQVRPFLEHAVQFWSPNLRRDIDKMEKIQRRATKMIPEIRNHSYHQRIQDLDLISLVQRRPRGQLIEVFKYLN